MARINLLPWREQRRAELKQAFLLIGAAVIVCGLALVFVVDLFFSAQVRNQRARNAYLRENIDGLNKQVEEISDMQRKRTQLLERIKVIQALQGNRPIIVRILDQLVRAVPDGVFYTELRADSRSINISGIAQSNSGVSGLMRRLDASDWFTEPNLEGVRAEPGFGEQATTFNMTVQLQLPSAGEAEVLQGASE